MGTFDLTKGHKRAGNFSYMEKLTVKYAGAAAMYMVSKKLKKKYNITDERAALYEAAETWTQALKGREFLGMFCSIKNPGIDIFHFIYNNLYCIFLFQGVPSQT